MPFSGPYFNEHAPVPHSLLFELFEHRSARAPTREGQLAETRSARTSTRESQLAVAFSKSAARELQEELGVESSLKRIGSFAPKPGVHYEHFVLYETRCEGPFTMQEEEVAALRFLSATDYDRMRRDPQETLTPSLCHLVAWLRAQGRYLPR